MIPKKINILGLTYDIKEVETVSYENLCNGLIIYEKQEILIDKHLTKAKKEQVLIHEIIHAILEQLNFKEENENEHLVQSVAIALHQIFNDLNIISS